MNNQQTKPPQCCLAERFLNMVSICGDDRELFAELAVEELRDNEYFQRGPGRKDALFIACELVNFRKNQTQD